MRYPKVSIIIVNWNGRRYLNECLTSVFHQTYPNYDVILVDNGSTDGSVEFVRKNCPKVKTIKLDRNYGFARGNNVGIEEALKDKNVKSIVSLNNDTKVDKNWLSELVKVAESNEKIGMCVPKILKMDNPAIIDSTGGILKLGLKLGFIVTNRGCGEVDKGQYDEKLDIMGIGGASGLYKREMLEEIGLFDESFFTYCEETELSWRANKKGWKARYVPASVVYHKGSGTSKKSKELEREMGFLWMRNWARTVKRHATPIQKFLFILKLAKTGIMSWVGMKIGRNDVGAKPFINAFKEFL